MTCSYVPVRRAAALKSLKTLALAAAVVAAYVHPATADLDLNFNLGAAAPTSDPFASAPFLSGAPDAAPYGVDDRSGPALSAQALRVSPPEGSFDVAALHAAPTHPAPRYAPGDRGGPWGASARLHAGDISRIVFDLVNAERARLGVAPLRAQSELARSAGEYSSEMISGDFFGHTDPSGKSFNERVHGFGLSGYRQLAENLFNSEGQVDWFAQANARATVDGWMNSRDGHREAMLDPELTVAGVGVALREGRYVVTMMFGQP